MDAGWFFWGALIGYWWGGWFADRRADNRPDPALTLLHKMITEVLSQRKFVGEGTSVTRFHYFDFGGERFMLSVQSEGKPALKSAA